MKKYAIVTMLQNRRTAFYYEDDVLCGISVLQDKCSESESSSEYSLGSICTARIQNLVPNIHAAFISIGEQTCYYSLEDNPHTIFLNPKKNREPHVGDVILAQIDREAVKTKHASATCYLNLTGEQLILTWQRPGCGLSKKLSKTQRTQLLDTVKSIPVSEELAQYGEIGWIVRTNAADATPKMILEEAAFLQEKLLRILAQARSSVAGKCLYRGDSDYTRLLQQVGGGNDNFIMTDDATAWARLQEACEDRHNPPALTLYDREVPLRALYDLNQRLKESLSRKVWLNGGGYLILEPTEALTVIDVNSGKSIHSRKDKEQHVLSVNLEAAACIARQLRVRNYSGIILIDFIDMEQEAHKHQLISYMRECLKKDSIKTTLVDITGLGLMELTRRKVTKPLHEQWKQGE